MADDIRERDPRWFAVPDDRTGGNTGSIIDRAGEQIAQCEYLEHAEHIVALHNAQVSTNVQQDVRQHLALSGVIEVPGEIQETDHA